MSLHLRYPLSVNHLNPDQNQFSEHLFNSLILNKDKNQVNEKILNLTLEIIFLLTGEDYMVVKKQIDHVTDSIIPCVRDEFCRTQSTVMEPSVNSLKQERDDDQKTLELTIKIQGRDPVNPELVPWDDSDSELAVSDHQDPQDERVHADTCAAVQIFNDFRYKMLEDPGLREQNHRIIIWIMKCGFHLREDSVVRAAVDKAF
ncbi:uncharacterized protein WCC33_000069 [Rhinophrynus dorsalis]